jgi:glycosyltransferase involved in cell wall biosynthesis
MKVAYILPKYDAKAGEHFVHIYSLLAELGKLDTVSVLVEKASGSPYFENVDSVLIVKSKFFLFRMFETFWKLLKLRFSGYKKFYVHYSFFGAIAGSIIARLSGGTVFYWNCGLPDLFFKSFGEKGWLASKFNDDWSLRVSLLCVNFLVTGTERMKHYYHETFNVPLRKILVLPNEIDLKRFSPVRPSNVVPQVFFVHRMSERKGAHYLVPIAERVLKEVDARFVIAGDGPFLHTLKSLISEKELDGRMVTLGSVPNKDVMKFYGESDVFLMPSDEEGFPRVLLEAMAMGVPFVASDVGGVRDIIPDSAQDFVVAKGDVDGFAKKLVLLLSDAKLRDRLSKDGISHVKKYDLRVVVKQLAKLLESHK